MTAILNPEYIKLFKKELDSYKYRKAIVQYVTGTINSIKTYWPEREFVLGLWLDSQGENMRLTFFYHDCKGSYFDSRGFKVGERVRVGINPIGILMNIERLDEAQPVRCECCATVLA